MHFVFFGSIFESHIRNQSCESLIMKRRTFITKSGTALTAFQFIPHFVWAQEKSYSILELMGKSDIKLFGKEINLREDAYHAFIDMRDAARSEGIEIQIVSSFRSFTRQKAIFERKYQRFTEEGLSPIDAIDKIIEYSTIPGTSRHHWGTDIDIIDGNVKTEGDVLVPEKFETGGSFAKLKEWMDAYATSFDFHLVYTDTPGRRGFKYEPWHYSYAPISIPMLTQFRKKNIMELLLDEDFEGIDHFTTGFLKTYIQDNILDINPALL